MINTQNMKQFSLKNLLLLCSLFIFNLNTFAQNYTWVKGSSASDQFGLYGSLGIASPTNNPGGREGAMSWKDGSGNFWLFGGNGFDNAGSWDMLNDLWKYNPTTNIWTWIKGDSLIDQSGIYGTLGVASPSNVPGARVAGYTWADANGNLWLFGGYGYDGATNTGELNDLWKYNIVSNQWTWIKGSNLCVQQGVYGSVGVPSASTIPGARVGGGSWMDASGNFWLFGGSGYAATFSSGDLDDLWKYNPTTNQWTWMKGTNLINQNGSYGTLGVSGPANRPGSRYLTHTWKDQSGNFWLLGGYGYDNASTFDDVLNDLWRYNPTTNEWTWIKGSNSQLQSGSYGSLGTAALANMPGARFAGISISDNNGDFWLMGGLGMDAASPGSDLLNDLWKYNVSSNQWTWMKGSNTQLQIGTYGTLGTPAPANTPGARFDFNAWVDNSNNVWLFGGSGYDGVNNMGEMNDLWKFSSCAAPSLSISSTNSLLCAGSTATLSALGASTYTWNGSGNGSSFTINPVQTTTYIVVGSTSLACNNAGVFVQAVAQNPTISLNVIGNTASCIGAIVTFSASGAVNYIWNAGQSGASINLLPSTLSTINLTCTGTDANGCKAIATISRSVSACTGIDTYTNTELSLYPNPTNGLFVLSLSTLPDNACRMLIYTIAGQKVYEAGIHEAQSSHSPLLPAGIYLIKLVENDHLLFSKKLVIE